MEAIETPNIMQILSSLADALLRHPENGGMTPDEKALWSYYIIQPSGKIYSVEEARLVIADHPDKPATIKRAQKAMRGLRDKGWVSYHTYSKGGRVMPKHHFHIKPTVSAKSHLPDGSSESGTVSTKSHLPINIITYNRDIVNGKCENASTAGCDRNCHGKYEIAPTSAPAEVNDLFGMKQRMAPHRVGMETWTQDMSRIDQLTKDYVSRSTGAQKKHDALSELALKGALKKPERLKFFLAWWYAYQGWQNRKPHITDYPRHWDSFVEWIEGKSDEMKMVLFWDVKFAKLMDDMPSAMRLKLPNGNPISSLGFNSQDLPDSREKWVSRLLERKAI